MMNISGTALKGVILIVLATCMYPAQTSKMANLGMVGSLDPTFGTLGMVVTPTEGAGTAVVIQPDGKILVAGSSHADLAVARYTITGTLDATFGEAGLALIDTGGTDEITDMVLQPDGRIVVAGAISQTFALARYNSDGSADTSWGGTGYITRTLGAYSSADTLDLQVDGKIVVGGYAVNYPNTDGVVARYQPDGSPDTSFGSEGYAVVGSSGGVSALEIQPDGKLVVAHQWASSGTVKMGGYCLHRLNADGSVDSSFTGICENPYQMGFEAAYIYASGAQLMRDSKIVIAVDNLLVRYTSTGARDTTLNGNGVITTTLPDRSVFFNEVVAQPHGGLLAVGNSVTTTNSYFFLASYTPSGVLDFYAETDLGGTSDTAADVALQSDNAIVVAGSSDNNFALARYINYQFSFAFLPLILKP